MFGKILVRLGSGLAAAVIQAATEFFQNNQSLEGVDPVTAGIYGVLVTGAVTLLGIIGRKFG